MTSRGNVIVIGAGPAGCLMAIHLARRGYRVTVYEQRGDFRTTMDEHHRSIGLTLSTRGLAALEEVGLLPDVLAASVPLRGRMVHSSGSEVSFQPYGTSPHEQLYSIRRSEVNAALLTAALNQPSVQICFNARCVRLDRERGEVLLYDQSADRQYTVTAEHIVGADGAFSAVRHHLHRGIGAEYYQESLSWGYKELVIPAGSPGTSELEPDALHVWPLGERLFLAIPAADGSFLGMCVLPFHGLDSFETLTTGPEVYSFLRRKFGDAVALTPGIVDQFLHNPTAAFITIRASPWHYQGRVVLIGDACHAVYPFYGQGLNAALEDCSMLNRCLEANGEDWEAACTTFETQRRPGTDALAELAKANFVELRDTSRSRLLVARKTVALALSRRFPTLWIPLYTMVCHSTMAYDAAVRRAQAQDRIARLLGLDVVVWGVAAWSALASYLRTPKPRVSENWSPTHSTRSSA
jgi:kynurenine 3-monooxygenase